MGAVDWLRLRDGLAHAAGIAYARAEGAAGIGLHASEAMTTTGGRYERMGFVVDGDQPINEGE